MYRLTCWKPCKTGKGYSFHLLVILAPEAPRGWPRLTAPPWMFTCQRWKIFRIFTTNLIFVIFQLILNLCSFVSLVLCNTKIVFQSSRWLQWDICPNDNLAFSSSSLCIFVEVRTTPAKASLISQRSTSEGDMPTYKSPLAISGNFCVIFCVIPKSLVQQTGEQMQAENIKPFHKNQFESNLSRKIRTIFAKGLKWVIERKYDANMFGVSFVFILVSYLIEQLVHGQLGRIRIVHTDRGRVGKVHNLGQGSQTATVTFLDGIFHDNFLEKVVWLIFDVDQ